MAKSHNYVDIYFFISKVHIKASYFLAVINIAYALSSVEIYAERDR